MTIIINWVISSQPGRKVEPIEKLRLLPSPGLKRMPGKCERITGRGPQP